MTEGIVNSQKKSCNSKIIDSSDNHRTIICPGSILLGESTASYQCI